jgi:SulP family sulfate permease
LGVIIQFFLFIFQSAERMTIMELVPTEDGDFEERPAPEVLPSDQVTMLKPYGSLFFAAAIDFEEEAPILEGTKHAAVIVVLRGHKQLGSTAIGVFERLAKALQEIDSRLFLVEVSDALWEQLKRTGTLDEIGEENIMPAGDKLLASLNRVYAEANQWLKNG